jgi:DNA repair exonuclease SbcCD ATPase subunit
MSSAELIALADGLYAAPPADFTPARDQAAKAAASKELGVQIKALKKPSMAAWAVNILVRREAEQIDQVLALADSLRAAAESMDGEELRTLTRQRRQLTAALTTAAAQLVREHGVRLTSAVSDQVEGVLTAAMLDPVAAEVVRTGLVLTAFTSTGVSEVDVAAVCAVPSALGHRAEPVVPAPPVLRVVPDTSVRREAATERVEEAVLGVAEATEELEHVTAAAEKLQARRLQFQGEIDELRRRLAGLEDDVERLDEDVEEAEEAIGEAKAGLEDAERALRSAQAELAKLESNS